MRLLWIPNADGSCISLEVKYVYHDDSPVIEDTVNSETFPCSFDVWL